jgi:GNAT superfamily N-acetyltransferase
MMLTFNGYEIDDSRERLDFGRICAMLAQSYWWPDEIDRNLVEKAAHFSSSVVGAYQGDLQVGYLRIVSDRVRFAYLCDVYVDEAHRRRGLGKALVQFALDHPDHQDVSRWLLATKDAHEVYQAVGFEPLPKPEIWMTRQRS